MHLATEGQIRQTLEIGVPGMATGLVAGAVVGGLAALIGQPLGWALAGALVLGLLFAAVGAGYGALLARGLAKPGVFAPAALLWLVGFPLGRLLHATFTPVLLGGPATPPADLLGFLAYQGIVSMGYAVGFIWLHERIAPFWLLRIRHRNPTAARVFETYAGHAAAVYERRARRRAGRSVRETRGGQ